MPASTFGMLLIPTLLAGGFFAIVVQGLLAGKIGSWSWLVALPAFIIGALATYYAMELSDFLLVHFCSCPKCGKHRWSWGYTRGFGL